PSNKAPLKSLCMCVQDKRRIREDIRHKRRDIEEEKLKLQYIKKKSLREQWLMGGLQSEEEQETMKLQAQDELQRTTQLQSNILRMEKEMEELEEAILRRLKEVERTTEDIIKVPQPEPKRHASSVSATFAMEISVELDKRTGKAQIISTATVTPDIIQGKGLKVYEDGRKSVYDMSEMTPTDVEDLLLQAIDWNGDVQYHKPVYAAPSPGQADLQLPRPPARPQVPSGIEDFQKDIEIDVIQTNNLQKNVGETLLHVNLSSDEMSPIPPFQIKEKVYSDVRSARSDQEAALVSVRESSNGMPTPTRPVYRNVETSRPSPQGYGKDEINLDRNSPTFTESTAYSLLEELDPGAVTMIFMGYENVDEDEEDSVLAEVVVIGDSDEEEGLNMEENPSMIYHPNGCTSRVYQPLARDGRSEELHRGGSLPHKPTFRHRAEKSDLPLQQSQKSFDRCVTDR
uniref:Palmdelphin n=1 Tax=Neogobius melanostomus TaxID=47308 RepID=A0A8C6UF80_9GOBI